MIGVGRQEFAKHFDVSRETMDRLAGYEALLHKWNPAINLVAKSTLNDVWQRHFLDSAQVFSLCPDHAKSWVDLGAGGGFPGLVVAILAAESRPDLVVTLVESDVRKATFLTTVARDLGLAVKVRAERIEALPALCADVLSARALAPLADLCAFAVRHMAPDGSALFQKGETWRQEVEEARKTWSFDLQASESLTDPRAAVLLMKGIKRV
jgi:16S rRNA (guanine527-N7)-methyltransferase